MTSDRKTALKVIKEQHKHEKDMQKLRVLQQLMASPMAQIVGTVAIAESLEWAGILSGRWAGAIEGGVITMVGLQALKDYGVIGAGLLGGGILTGGLLGTETTSELQSALKTSSLELIAGPAAGLLQSLGIIPR